MITPPQIKAARALLNWSQSELAQRTGLTQATIANIEVERHAPSKSSIVLLQSAFENSGVEFIPGGVRQKDSFMTVIEGSDCFLRLLEDIYFTLKNTGGELLLSGSDERRSTPSVVSAIRRLRSSGIEMRSIIAESNDYIMGQLDEYRLIPDEYFSTEVTTVYGQKLALVADEPGLERVVIIRNKHLADDMRRIFNFMWKNGKAPTESGTKERYELLRAV